jgi:hypothetical protein
LSRADGELILTDFEYQRQRADAAAKENADAREKRNAAEMKISQLKARIAELENKQYPAS